MCSKSCCSTALSRRRSTIIPVLLALGSVSIMSRSRTGDCHILHAPCKKSSYSFAFKTEAFRSEHGHNGFADAWPLGACTFTSDAGTMR